MKVCPPRGKGKIRGGLWDRELQEWPLSENAITEEFSNLERELDFLGRFWLQTSDHLSLWNCHARETILLKQKNV